MKCCTVLLLAALIICSGCVAMLEDYTRSESLHVAVVNESPPEEQIEVSDYEELKATMLALIAHHEVSGLMVVYSYDGDVQADVDRSIYEIMNDVPIAVYAVSEIDGTVTRIVSYFEIDIKIEYKRTKEQVDSIVAVPTFRALRTELQSIMSEYREEAVFLTSLQVTEDNIVEFVRDTYYQNPGSIVMMPVMVVTTFTTGRNERLIELRFRSLEEESVLRQFGASLAGSVRRNALAAEGETDAEILLSLVENFIGACSFDEATARTISEHGVQNLAATAYHALVRGSAVGEGFAMAFKSLCDELRLDCRVVLGYRNGMVHAWNIVSLYGDNYHIDAAMCALNGVETAFFKTDADFMESYTWNIDNYVECNGTLTYWDIADVGPGDNNGDGIEDENGDENGDTLSDSQEVVQ